MYHGQLIKMPFIKIPWHLPDFSQNPWLFPNFQVSLDLRPACRLYFKTRKVSISQNRIWKSQDGENLFSRTIGVSRSGLKRRLAISVENCRLDEITDIRIEVSDLLMQATSNPSRRFQFFRVLRLISCSKIAVHSNMPGNKRSVATHAHTHIYTHHTDATTLDRTRRRYGRRRIARGYEG